jgi:6-pyruvoyltetrahydropterin/6-carboxytetrahydropterin synthase
MSNGEREVSLESVIVHETDSGYAQCFKEDAYNHKNMGLIELKKIIFSNQISSEWGDSDSWKRLINGAIFKNPKEC